MWNRWNRDMHHWTSDWITSSMENFIYEIKMTLVPQLAVVAEFLNGDFFFFC